jgi:hypothetical protein
LGARFLSDREQLSITILGGPTATVAAAWIFGGSVDGHYGSTTETAIQ